MPQLDQIIIFTQLFWLFIIFFCLYVLTIHFFLPFMIRTFKVRSLFVKSVNEYNEKIQLDFYFRHNLLIKTISRSLQISTFFLTPKFLFSTEQKKKASLHSLDVRLFVRAFDIVLYCDERLLPLVSLISKTHNFTLDK